MITMPNLQTSLLDLVFAIDGSDIKLIIGGGFGIYLKVDYVRRNHLRTRLVAYPEPRSTIDLDLFLCPELLIESTRLKPLAEALAKLGYEVVPGAEKYQFVKPGPEGSDKGGVKIDFLTGPKASFLSTSVKVDSRRARPDPSMGIHAHPVDEAPTLEEGIISVPLEGKLSSGEFWKTEVFLPHPYTYSMMKLFAFKDRFNDEDKEFGRYHALDLYSIIATTTEEEWSSAPDLIVKHNTHPYVMEAGKLVLEYFADPEGMGMIRLRESPYYRNDYQIEEFMSVLQELFPSIAGQV